MVTNNIHFPQYIIREHFIGFTNLKSHSTNKNKVHMYIPTTSYASFHSEALFCCTTVILVCSYSQYLQLLLQHLLKKRTIFKIFSTYILYTFSST